MPRVEWVPGIDLPGYAERWVDMVPHITQLTGYARTARTIVEFGVRGGVSTWALLDGLPEDGRLVAVDVDPEVRVMTPPWVLADPRLTLIVGDDREVALPVATADLVMIDSSHEYRHTLDELGFAGRLAPQGRILLHDYLYAETPGVREAVDEYTRRCAPYVRLATVHPSRWGLAVVEPVPVA